MNKMEKGAWIIHHSRKILSDIYASSEFSSIDATGKMAELLIKMGETKESSLSRREVDVIARTMKLNPLTELPSLLKALKDRRLIDSSQNEFKVLGVTISGVLSHAADIFDQSKPINYELAAIELGEMASNQPLSLLRAREYIGDTYKMTSVNASEFIRRSSEIGFVDQEGDDEKNILLFNGNIFKRNNVCKTQKVLSSLPTSDKESFDEFNEKIKKVGCLYYNECSSIMGESLIEKMQSSAVIEVNVVSNEQGEHPFITMPGAFHKFINPLVDDTFDMAKALVSALSYGMKLRDRSQGRIFTPDTILNALIRGDSIGPATAIGNDYRVLEQHRVVKITQAEKYGFHMRLLKKEIGELALKVLTEGSANFDFISDTRHAANGEPISKYMGPEASREITRKKQSKPSKEYTYDILGALRSGGAL